MNLIKHNGVTVNNAQRVEDVDVVSIQSQVVYGSVGNSVAMPTFRSHGVIALGIPTFLLSNTPHYSTCYGGEVDDGWFKGFLNSVKERQLDGQLKIVLVGYLGSINKAQMVTDWFQSMSVEKHNVQLIVDPVIGDFDTGYYVSPELVTFYRDTLIPLSTGITPNLFELEQLSGQRLKTTSAIVSATRTLLRGNTQWAVITSAEISEKCIKIIYVTNQQVEIIEHDYVPVSPKGTGDLFTAELVVGLLQARSIPESIQRASQITQQRILETVESNSIELAIAY